MDKLQIFKNPEFGEIRTVIIDGKPFAVGVDVARALGYKNPNDAVTRHCRGCVKHAVTDSLGRLQETGVIPEGDIYRLIVGSELPAAEKFEQWIFDEVLPAIRQTGGYMPTADSDPLVAQAQAVLAQAKMLKEVRQQVAAHDKQIGAIKDAIQLQYDEDWRREINQNLNRIGFKLGGNEHYRNVKAASYESLDSRAKSDLARRLTNLKSRLRKQGEKMSKVDSINYLDVIEMDARLKEIYTGIVKEMVIKYLT